MSRPRFPGLILGIVLACAIAPPAGPASPPESPAPVHVRVQPHRTRWDRLDAWRLRVRLDFGPEDRVEPGSEPCDAMDWSPYASWSRGMVRPVARPGNRDVFLGDGIEGESAALLIATDPGRAYRMILTLGDAEAPRGPIRVSLGDRVLADSLTTAPGEFTDVIFDLTAITARTRVDLEARPCSSFSAAGLAVYAEGLPPGRKPRTRRDLEPPAGLRADPDSLSARARRTLARYADYLVASQPVEGGFSHNGNWYECAYPVRTLLWASRVLGEPRHAEAALACLDRFLAEQRADGLWAAHYFGHPGCPLALAMAEEGRSRNLADVGSLALCLPLAAGFAGEEGADRYLRASRGYADRVVLPAQLPSGAFPNGRFEGVEYRFPYSVATAVQASHLAELHRATGEERYRDAAVRAGLFLAASVEEDGSVRLYPHDRAETVHLPAEKVGDLFYVVEGILRAHRVARGADREVLAAALDRYFHGGSLSGLGADPAAWLLGGDVWERSKRAGILYLLAGYASTREGTAELAPLIARVYGALEDPAFARRLGVGAAPEAAEIRYAMAATGFAGIGVAALADSSTLFGPAR